jgi:hypothetical protein
LRPELPACGVTLRRSCMRWTREMCLGEL